jgi:prepilin-type N-terminal cleavage/methylation domain-containing protein
MPLSKYLATTIIVRDMVSAHRRQRGKLLYRTRALRAFTLIELIVVMTILVVLTAFIFPAFTAAKSSAAMRSSASNLHQLALAAILYAGDNDDLLPCYQNDEIRLLAHDPEVTNNSIPTNSKNPQELVQCLSPYLRNKAVWFTSGDPYRGTASVFGGINHLYSSYKYSGLPAEIKIRLVWPLVASTTNLLPPGALFFEPRSIANGHDTYWSGELLQGALVDGSVHMVPLVSRYVGPR